MNKFHFKYLFVFSKSERRGVFTLLVIILLLVLVRVKFDIFFPDQKEPVDSEFVNEVDSFLNSYRANNLRHEVQKEGVTANQFVSPRFQLFDFDPNKISPQGWRRLGLNDKQTETILNYKKSGGRFYKKEDLKKIYGIGNKTYSRLKEYIKIEDETPAVKDKLTATKELIPKIEINSADTFRLISLKGIGPVYARRICKYRDLLGGFYSEDQLKEVYGITDAILALNDSSIIIDSSHVRQIDINEAGFTTLIRHPYLNEYQTKAIMNYRQFKGGIEELEELLLNNILSEDAFNRIKPYIVVMTD